ncbi:DNA polymerase III subunit delta [Spirulina major CS-329]|uniref:DNA polymerase III subunit delta n=1 Tax=Spirulina TaxID=1154 RepID=UPI00232F9A17|nr:DNA polymerase III subunit delta [Spirulina major]MDB9501447.1 DNA polymerase III subunit delta [Spirulina major CS-329]
MPIYLFWGEDDFAMGKAIAKLQDAVLDPNWLSFNTDKLTADSTETLIDGLNQAMTPPFGMGGRFVWLENTTVCQTCPETLLNELKRTLPNLPPTSTLLLTSRKKPDGRAKSTKLLQKHAEIREFALIPPWRTDDLIRNVQQVAREMNLKLTPRAVELLAESIGNNTRQLWSELEKLQLFGGDTGKPIDDRAVAQLTIANTQNSLQLATAIRDGKTDQAVGLVAELLNLNEPPLRIVATLIGQFRTWLLIRVMIESGETDDSAIAKFAELGNPKRLYFLRKELNAIAAPQLLRTLPLLRDLELGLKRGANPEEFLQMKVVELCLICQPAPRAAAPHRRR